MEPPERHSYRRTDHQRRCTHGNADAGGSGADVIRIEEVGAGDSVLRRGAVRNGVTSYYLSLNRNKRAISIDLKDTCSRPLMADLLRSADVFVHNTRPGVMERLNYGHDAVHALN
ncbi:MAG: CoA transferase [Gammaproteobacteria bacterium]|nr:CoA transferase [Gammaproteobacteria bacterium]